MQLREKSTVFVCFVLFVVVVNFLLFLFTLAYISDICNETLCLYNWDVCFTFLTWIYILYWFTQWFVRIKCLYDTKWNFEWILFLLMSPLHVCSVFVSPLCAIQIRTSKKKKMDKNGLISWQIPTSGLENGTIFVLIWIRLNACWNCTGSCLTNEIGISIQLGETNATRGEKIEKKAWNSFQVKKNIRVLYIAYKYVFWEN